MVDTELTVFLVAKSKIGRSFFSMLSFLDIFGCSTGFLAHGETHKSSLRKGIEKYAWSF